MIITEKNKGMNNTKHSGVYEILLLLSTPDDSESLVIIHFFKLVGWWIEDHFMIFLKSKNVFMSSLYAAYILEKELQYWQRRELGKW